MAAESDLLVYYVATNSDWLVKCTELFSKLPTTTYYLHKLQDEDLELTFTQAPFQPPTVGDPYTEKVLQSVLSKPPIWLVTALDSLLSKDKATLSASDVL